MHPLVTQMSLSDNQKPAITTRGCDVLVLAGAGTGKTRTLVARYLSLLAEGLALRSVIAITFTKKAAWEMRNRVRTEVSRYLEGRDLTGDERQRWQDLYAKLDAARIGTIHSLCTEILRTHPVEADVDPLFDVSDEGHATILINRAIDEALAWAADRESVVPLFVLLGEQGLRTTLDGLMQRRLDAERVFAQQADELTNHWKTTLLSRQEQILEVLQDNSSWTESIHMLECNIANNGMDKTEIQRQKALAAVNGATASSLAEQLESLSSLQGISLLGGSFKAWPGGKEQLADVKQALRTLRTMWRERADLLELTVTPMDEILADSIPLLRQMFTFANARYSASKRERNALDFDDLESGALALLQAETSVRAYWQAEIGAILVDEFQDTNRRQRDLLHLLNGGKGRLFAVGDAKQSIYRFRGADVTVFREEQQRIERDGGAVLTLDTSYRAHRALVEALNDLLRPVLGEEDQGSPWVQPFSPLKYRRENRGPGFASPDIELLLTVGSKGSGALARSADALVERIVNLVESKDLRVTENGHSRALSYGDIAILCRASSSFAAYEDALEGRVPFLTVAGRGFYGRSEVRDILNALQALADPTDDLALAGILRSPSFALSDVALYRIHQQRNGLSLWEALRETRPDVLREEFEPAQRAIETIDALNKQAGRTPVATLLKRFLDNTNYRAALIKSGQKRGARNVAKLLTDAHASGIVSVGEFLEYVANLRDSGAREGEARDTSEGVVQIMSIHAAKGLEFPIVIIGDITYNRRGRNDLLIDPDLGALLPIRDENENLSMAYQLGKFFEDSQETAESNRLFYVAATRAREKLILNGCVELKQDKTLRNPKGWLGQACEPSGLHEIEIESYNDEGEGAIHLNLAIGLTPLSCTICEPGYVWDFPIIEGKAATEHPVSVPPPLLKPVSARDEPIDQRAEDRDRIPPQRVWQVVPTVKRPRAPAWVIGSIVHEALGAWRFTSDRFAELAEARARECGITDRQQLRHASRESHRLLLRFQAHPLFQEMDGATRRLHEVPYSIPASDRSTENGVMDALFMQGGVWTIVEFKTDAVRNQTEFERILDKTDYLCQAQRYVNAAEQLLGQRPRALLCMLNFGGTVNVLEYNDIEVNS